MLLRREVEIAGECYEQTMKRVLSLLETAGAEDRPALAEAIELLGRSLSIYTDALRRLAAFAGRERAAANSPKYFVAHA